MLSSAPASSVPFAFVRKFRILLELLERGVADDAAVHRLIAFNRMCPAAIAAKPTTRWSM